MRLLFFLQFKFSELPDEYYLKEGDKFIKEFLSSVKLKIEEKERLIDYFTSSKEKVEKFYNKLITLWDAYLDNLAKVKILREFNHVLPYYKIKYLRKFVNDHLELNKELYKLSSVEKEIIERAIFKYLDEEELEEFFNFNKNFFSEFSRLFSKIKKTSSIVEFYEEVLKKEELVSFFSNFGFNLRSLMKKSNELYKEKETYDKYKHLKNTDNYKKRKIKNESLFNILRELFIFDNYLEKGWIETKVVLEDLKFYVDLANNLSTKKDFESLFKALNKREEITKRKFIFDIPKYTQTSDSCGAVCLLNAYSYFFNVKPTKELERFIEEKVKVKGFYNNIPSSLALTAIETFGMPAKFFAEMKTFSPLYLKEEINEIGFPPLKKFREDFEKLKEYNAITNYDNITPEKLEEKIKKGIIISFVKGKSPMLHYNMIIGYKKTNKENFFYIFDPLGHIFKVKYEKIIDFMRNDKSLWGVEYYSPDNFLYNKEVI